MAKAPKPLTAISSIAKRIMDSLDLKTPANLDELDHLKAGLKDNIVTIHHALQSLDRMQGALQRNDLSELAAIKARLVLLASKLS